MVGGAIEGSLLSIEDSLKGLRLGEGGVKVGVWAHAPLPMPYMIAHPTFQWSAQPCGKKT